MQSPTVSIVMATYNGEKYVKEQLDSIIKQTYPLLEIIIQDDGSTDHTIDIIKEYAARDSRIHIYSNNGTHGVNGNFYSAMKRASGDYIAISDQDDIWYLNKIEKQVEALNSTNGKVLCCGKSVPFSGDGSFVSVDKKTPNHGLLRLIYSAEIPGHTMLIERKWLERLPWESNMVKNRIYDWTLSIAAAATDSLIWIDTPLVKHRYYIDSATYADMSESVPSWRNSLHILLWCMNNYKRVKIVTKNVYNDVEEFLKKLYVDNSVCKEAIKMMHLEQSISITAFLHLQWLCLKHHKEILHTNDESIKNIIHAVTFPLMSCWYKRFKLEKK